jgi:Arc/MetJ-type ribon-helix-helix transcriptional regulator
MSIGRKNRTISLRLSEHEVDALKALCVRHGARSVSEFIRALMHRMISEDALNIFHLELKVKEIDGNLSVLDSEVARLSLLLEGPQS